MEVCFTTKFDRSTDFSNSQLLDLNNRLDPFHIKLVKVQVKRWIFMNLARGITQQVASLSIL